MKARAGLTVGIGIDLVYLPRFRTMKEKIRNAFYTRAFTPAEQEESAKRHDPDVYFAGRFAVKEAVYKAAAHLVEGGFDLRKVETLTASDGRPVVSMDGELGEKLRASGIDDVLVSISNEEDYVTAIAHAIRYMED